MPLQRVAVAVLTLDLVQMAQVVVAGVDWVPLERVAALVMLRSVVLVRGGTYVRGYVLVLRWRGVR